MSVGKIRRRPIEFDCAGPWDGTLTSTTEIADFVALTNTKPVRYGDGFLEIWDFVQQSWVKAFAGHTVLRGTHGENWVIDDVHRAKAYEEIEDLGVSVE